jgi:hypothetical protein
MRRLLLLLVVITTYLLLNTSSALGCTCAFPRNATEALNRARAVFAGEVVKVTPPKTRLIDRRRKIYEISLELKATFKVERVWKSGVRHRLVVSTMSGCCACGWDFKVGERYLIFAHGDSDSTLSTSICSGTKRLENAQEYIQELGEGTVVTPHGGSSKPKPLRNKTRVLRRREA